MSWIDPLRARASRGSTAARPGSMAGLAATRKAHQGQFFTPDALAATLWRLVTPAMDAAKARSEDARVAILDNSVGSARLLQYAAPESHYLAGVDVDADLMRELKTVAEEAKFQCEFMSGGMERIRPKGFGVGLINPPFSLHLETPTLEPYLCTAFGKYGPNTSTVSHAYALHQALAACDIVAAILPITYAEEAAQDKTLNPRLRAVVKLPPKCFSEEGTSVNVAILVFGKNESPRAPIAIKLDSLDDALPKLDLYCCNTHENTPRLHPKGLEDNAPAITLPVTGKKTVRVSHNGRRINLKFECGLTQAKVMNEVLDRSLEVGRPENHRYPRGVEFSGQGVLDVEIHLAQPDPQASLNAFLKTIRAAGGRPEIDEGFKNYFAKRIRGLEREITPFRHTVYLPKGAVSTGSKGITGRARKTFVLDPTVWGSPLLKAGQKVTLTPVIVASHDHYRITIDGKHYDMNADTVYERFEIDEGAHGGGWTVVHEGRIKKFPALAHALRQRIKRHGIDKWLTWGFQQDDLVESFLSPHGAIMAWTMGLGKARLAVALCLLSECRHNLIVVEPHLVPEMLRELNGLFPENKLDAEAGLTIEDVEQALADLNVDQSLWQVIREPSDLKTLKRINIISYNRLRMPINPAHQRRTYASRLRRRIGLLAADEGHLLRNTDTQQTRALWQVSAKKKFIMTGTPAANYPRDIHPLLAFVAGDGTAAQPYGIRRMYLEPALRQSMAHCMRGVDRFREDFISLEWVTNEFAEDNQTGAKREIPRIKNLPAYRAMIAHHVKRRVLKEPEVLLYVRIPDPRKIITEIDWDIPHLIHYLRVAQDFRAKYIEAQRKAGKKGISVNLVAILAQIGAVQFACNYPRHYAKGIGNYHPLTSKQRFAIGRLVELAATGHKTILYADSPELLDMLGRELAAARVDSVVFHGGRSIEDRTAELDARFRFGPCTTLLASEFITQTGLNVPQSDRIMFYNRAWSAKTEDQAGARVLRPQQLSNDVLFEYLHLRGSIDLYQAQMVDFKKDSIDAGLDWGTPVTDGVDFLHMETILGRFCENLAGLYNCKTHDLRKTLESLQEAS